MIYIDVHMEKEIPNRAPKASEACAWKQGQIAYRGPLAEPTKLGVGEAVGPPSDFPDCPDRDLVGPANEGVAPDCIDQGLEGKTGADTPPNDEDGPRPIPSMAPPPRLSKPGRATMIFGPTPPTPPSNARRTAPRLDGSHQ
jgi:hypothetical protein